MQILMSANVTGAKDSECRRGSRRGSDDIINQRVNSRCIDRVFLPNNFSGQENVVFSGQDYLALQTFFFSALFEFFSTFADLHALKANFPVDNEKVTSLDKKMFELCGFTRSVDGDYVHTFEN